MLNCLHIMMSASVAHDVQTVQHGRRAFRLVFQIELRTNPRIYVKNEARVRRGVLGTSIVPTPHLHSDIRPQDARND